MTLEIGSGSVVAVDTRSLREAAAQFEAAAAHFDLVHDRARAAAWATPPPIHAGPVETTAQHAAQLAEDVRGTARSLRGLADAYEIVEAEARIAMLGTTTGRERIQAVRAWEERMLAAEERSPGAMAEAQRLTQEEALRWPGELIAQSSLGMSGLPALAAMLAGMLALARVSGMGRGVVSGSGRPRGSADPIRLGTFRTSTGTAVSGLADAARRIPTSPHAQVRVEKYVFADRPPEYAVYISGTRDMSPEAGREPLDWTSNLLLYSGLHSSSYAAVEAALRDAGAPRGATVHAFGHSQGGMIASRLALAGDYRVQTLVTYGAPISVVPPADTLNVTLRYEDDWVATGLTHGGAPIAGGAPGSVLVRDVHDPGAERWDLGMEAHGLEAYERLAEGADASADPRLAATADRLAHLADAESVEVTDCAAERVPRG